MIINALKSAIVHHPSLSSYSLPKQITLKQKPSAIRFVYNKSDEEMDPKTDPESETTDTMSSFGEGYATRSDDEGFGGIYGGNQYVVKDKPQDHKSQAEDGQEQGSEVKEKENARNQSKA